jgi:biopolymer transport protein ExbD
VTIVRFLRNRRREADALDITPLVDVVFLLNIFFLLTSSYYLYSGIKITIPKGAGDPLGSPDAVVSVTHHGKVYLQNEPQPLSVNDLVRRLRGLLAEKSDLVVLLRGDADCRFGRLVEVYSACKTSGVASVRVHTRSMVIPPGAPGPTAGER